MQKRVVTEPTERIIINQPPVVRPAARIGVVIWKPPRLRILFAANVYQLGLPSCT